VRASGSSAPAALDHPYICKIFEVDTLDDRPSIVMEHVEGETLVARLRRGRLEDDDLAADLGDDDCRGEAVRPRTDDNRVGLTHSASMGVASGGRTAWMWLKGSGSLT